MKPWERYKELKPLTEEQKAKPSGDYSKGVPLAALTGTLEGLVSGLESYANGYTLGGYDWLNRQLGRNPQDLRDKLQQRADSVGLGGYNMVGQLASGMGGALRGLPKLTGMAGEAALGSKYWGLPAMALGGSLDAGIQSSFDNDFSNAGDIAVDTLQGGAIGVGMGGVGDLALKPLAKYTSSNAMTKGLKGGLKNVADNPQALKIANEAVRKNDDIAQLYLDNLLNAADDVNRDSSNLIRNSLARRIDVPSTLNKENLKYSQFMKEHGQDELLDFSNDIEKSYINLQNLLKSTDGGDFSLGSLSKPQLDAINDIRVIKGLPILDENMVIPENVIVKFRDKRIKKDGYTPQGLADDIFDFLTNPENIVGGSKHEHIQSILHPRKNVSKVAYISQNGKNGDTVLKSIYKKDNTRIIKENPEYRGVLEGHGADPSSATQISSGRPQLSARQNSPMSSIIANKNIVVNSKIPHISTLYEGLNPYQREALTDAINQGRKMTNSKLGSLDSINEAKKSLNDMITTSFRGGENAKVFHLEGVKDRLDNVLGKGLKGRDRTFSRAKRMEDAFEKGKKYNPNNLEQTEYMENFNPLEKNAFAQGLMKRVTHNPLTSKNLSKKALDYNNTFREVLPTSKYNELRRGLNKNSVLYERLANIGARAENKLRIPEGSRVFLREQLEETTPQKIGLPALVAMLDEALYRGHKKALNKAAINLLDPTFEGVEDAWLIENYPTLNAYISGVLANE